MRILNSVVPPEQHASALFHKFREFLYPFWSWTLLIIGTSLALYLDLFRFPFTPRWLDSDQYGFALDAARMWRGEIIYKDFFELTPPGIEIVHLLWMRVFGLRNYLPHLNMLLVAVLFVLLLASLGQRIFAKGSMTAFLPAILFLGFGYLPVVQDSHRWFSSLFSVAALLCITRTRSRLRLAFAGALCGIACLFTQTQGVFAVAGIFVFLLWDLWPRENRWGLLVKLTLWLSIPFAITVLATLARFLLRAGWGAFADCLIDFPAKYYALDRGNNSFAAYLGSMPALSMHVGSVASLCRYLLIHALVPFVYLVFLTNPRFWKDRTAQQRSLMLICISGLCWSAAVAPSPSYFRLCSISAPAFVLATHWLSGASRVQRLARRTILVATMLTIAYFPYRAMLLPSHILMLSRGPISFTNTDAVDFKVIEWLSTHTQPDEIALLINDPNLAYPVALRPVQNIASCDNSGYTRARDIIQTINTLNDYKIRLIAWPPQSVPAQYYRRDEDHLQPLNDFVQRHYAPLQSFSGDGGSNDIMAIWQRIQ